MNKPTGEQVKFPTMKTILTIIFTLSLMLTAVGCGTTGVGVTYYEPRPMIWIDVGPPIYAPYWHHRHYYHPAPPPIIHHPPIIVHPKPILPPPVVRPPVIRPPQIHRPIPAPTPRPSPGRPPGPRR